MLLWKKRIVLPPPHIKKMRHAGTKVALMRTRPGPRNQKGQ
jgi:hypothetical protein